MLPYIVAGFPNKQIAFQLSIAETIVKVHRGRVVAKPGVNSPAKPVRLAEKAGVGRRTKPNNTDPLA